MAKKIGYIHLHISGILPILSKCQYQVYIDNVGIVTKLPLTGEIEKIGRKTLLFQYEDTKISIDDMLITYQIIISSNDKSLKQGTLIASDTKNFDITGRNSNSISIGSTASLTQKNKKNEKLIKIKKPKYIVWKGTYSEISTGRKIIDTKLYEFKLISECVGGVRYTTYVRATAEVFVTDISILGDSSIGKGEVTFYQKANTPLNPKVFNGVFALGVISGSFGYTAAGPLAMGETLGDNSGPGTSSDLIAIEMGRGTAKVTSYTKEECN